MAGRARILEGAPCIEECCIDYIQKKIIRIDNILDWRVTFLEVQFLYESSFPSVGWLVGHNFLWKGEKFVTLVL